MAPEGICDLSAKYLCRRCTTQTIEANRQSRMDRATTILIDLEDLEQRAFSLYDLNLCIFVEFTH